MLECACSILHDGTEPRARPRWRPFRRRSASRGSCPLDSRAAAHLPCRAARNRQRRPRGRRGGHVAVERPAPAPPSCRHPLRSQLGSGARGPRPPPRRSVRPRSVDTCRAGAARVRRACRVAAACSPRRCLVLAAWAPRGCSEPAASRAQTRGLPAAIASKHRDRVNFVNHPAIRRRACPGPAALPDPVA